MNVFVLSTGRCGTLTMTSACSHMTNFTAAHESRSEFLGMERVEFDDQHIEIDNRLSWFLGRLDKRWGNDAYYVHLIRDRDETAASYNQRWFDRGVMKSYCHGILMRHYTEGLDVCEDYYDTVNENIETFLKDKTQKQVIRLETFEQDFRIFWNNIGAQGDLDAALGALSMQQNVTSETTMFPPAAAPVED